MLSVEAFRPNLTTGTIALQLGTAVVTGTLQLTAPNTQISCRLYNAGSNVAFVNLSGTSTVTASAVTTASAGSFPVAPGSVEVINVGQSQYAAGVCGNGTTIVYFTTGYGL